MGMTHIPALILSLLGNPDPASVQTTMDVGENVVCWASPERAVCFGYSDEGTHLAVDLGNEVWYPNAKDAH